MAVFEAANPPTTHHLVRPTSKTKKKQKQKQTSVLQSSILSSPHRHLGLSRLVAGPTECTHLNFFSILRRRVTATLKEHRPGTYFHIRIGYLPMLWSHNSISTALSNTYPTRRPEKPSRMSTQQRELVILLIGPSGSGKSSFVKSLTTEAVRIAKSEKPCTCLRFLPGISKYITSPTTPC